MNDFFLRGALIRGKLRFWVFPKISLNKLPILRGAPLGPRSMIMNALVYVGKGQGIHGGKNKVTPNEKWKELDMWVFLSIKYSQLWSILVEHFNKYKPIISEGMVCVLTITSGNNWIFFYPRISGGKELSHSVVTGHFTKFSTAYSLVLTGKTS